MEKILDRWIRDKYLIGTPLHELQRSLVRRIKQTFDTKEILLCCFIDIEGAFNLVTYDTIQAVLEATQVNAGTINWIMEILRKRIMRTKLSTVETKFSAIKGYPQGGKDILSPHL